MSKQNEKNLFEMVMLVQRELRHLRQLVHLQHAEIQALRIYSVARIADLSRQARKSEFDKIEKIVREIYDRHISALEAASPAIASDIDIRKDMNPQEQELWYLLEKYYPNKGKPPTG
jgi:hypothetical protein